MLADLDARVAGWTDDLVRAAPLAVRAIKQAAMRSLDLPLAEAFTVDYPAERRRMTGADAVEGPRAFTERRDPR